MKDIENRLSSPEKEKVIRVFGNYFFIVPKYQRSYVWSDRGKSEQLIQFWDDFLDTEKSQGNLPFLGNLILSKTSDNGKYDVVDGQQRLITLQILFRVMHTKISELGGSTNVKYKSILDSLMGLLVSHDDYGTHESLKLTAGKDIDKYYRELILNGKLATDPIKKDSHWNIWNAHNFFSSKIDEFISVPKTAEAKIDLIVGLFRKIGEVQFIIITLGDQSDAYEVFESFNAKGARLNTADLFKNLILSKLDGKEDLNKAYSKWEGIVDNVRTINQYLPQFTLDTYLRYYWSSTYGYTNPRGLYREIKEGTTNYSSLLAGLYKTSITLATILDVEHITPWTITVSFPSESDPQGKESNRIYASLKGLNSLRIQQYLVWLICIIRNWESLKNRKHLQKSLSSIESFSVLYFTGGASSANKIEKIFSSLSRELSVSLGIVHDKKIVPRTKETLMLHAFTAYVKEQELIPSLEEFALAFNRFKYIKGRNRANVFYLLEKIELKRRSSTEMNIDSITTTVEHLLPQVPADDWKLTRDEIKPYIDLIGNLTLLDFEINSSVKSGTPEKKLRTDPDDKRKYLDDSELLITKEIVNLWKGNGFIWNEELIRFRQNEIARELYEIFAPQIG